MSLPTDEDFYKPFTKEQWVEWQEMAQATELQLLFSIHKFRGASSVQSAKLAGYSSTGDSLKKTAYEVVRSNGVTKLMQFAMASAPLEISKLTEEELDRVIAGLVRSKDPQSIKVGVEQYEKRKQRAKEAGETPTDDGLSAFRLERDFLLQPNGAVAYVFMHGISNCHLLHDTYSLLMQQEFGPEIWSRFYAKLNDGARSQLDGLLADPVYQLEVRKKIWAEVEIDITKVDKPKHLRAGMNGHKEIAANA